MCLLQQITIAEWNSNTFWNIIILLLNL
jgi:hypothetical protein